MRTYDKTVEQDGFSINQSLATSQTAGNGDNPPTQTLDSTFSSVIGRVHQLYESSTTEVITTVIKGYSSIPDRTEIETTDRKYKSGATVDFSETTTTSFQSGGGTTSNLITKGNFGKTETTWASGQIKTNEFTQGASSGSTKVGGRVEIDAWDQFSDQYQATPDQSGSHAVFSTTVEGERITKYMSLIGTNMPPVEKYGPLTIQNRMGYHEQRFTFNPNNPPPQPTELNIPGIDPRGGDGYTNEASRFVGNLTRAVVGDAALANASDAALFGGTVAFSTVVVLAPYAVRAIASSTMMCSLISYSLTAYSVYNLVDGVFTYLQTGQGGLDTLKFGGQLAIDVFANKVRPWLKVAARVTEAISNFHSGYGSYTAGNDAYNRGEYMEAYKQWTFAATDGIAGFGALASLKYCFAAGTPVSTPQGLLPIESIRTGMEVWAYDLVARACVPRKVLRTFSSEYEGAVVHLRVAGEILTSTARHPFWVVRGERLWERSSLEHLPKAPEGTTQEGAWVDACDLEEGDELLLQSGRVAHVQSLSTVGTAILVYNFEVTEHHDYAIGAVRCLVHNAYVVTNSGGRLGIAATRAKTSEVIDNFRSRGFTEIHTEVQFRAGSLGSGKRRFADLVGRNPVTDETEIIQIGRTLKIDPRVQVIRERHALDDIILSPDIRNYLNAVIRFVDVNRLGVIQP